MTTAAEWCLAGGTVAALGGLTLRFARDYYRWYREFERDMEKRMAEIDGEELFDQRRAEREAARVAVAGLWARRMRQVAATALRAQLGELAVEFCWFTHHIDEAPRRYLGRALQRHAPPLCTPAQLARGCPPGLYHVEARAAGGRTPIAGATAYVRVGPDDATSLARLRALDPAAGGMPPATQVLLDALLARGARVLRCHPPPLALLALEVEPGALEPAQWQLLGRVGTLAPVHVTPGGGLALAWAAFAAPPDDAG